MSIPGFRSLKEFALFHSLPYTTVRNHMLSGKCNWPRKIDDGLSKHPLYKTWENMISRCNNPKATGYLIYGGRGIKVCGRWLSFRNFLADMGEKPGPEFTLDRMDVNGDYEPKNCRWATLKEQAANTRKGLGAIHNSNDRTNKPWALKVFDTYIDRFDSKEDAEIELETWTALVKVRT